MSLAPVASAAAKATAAALVAGAAACFRRRWLPPDYVRVGRAGVPRRQLQPGPSIFRPHIMRQYAGAGRLARAAYHRAGTTGFVSDSSMDGAKRPGFNDALGVQLQAMGELTWPQMRVDGSAEERTFMARERLVRKLRDSFMIPASASGGSAEEGHCWESTRPCVIRGFAQDCEFVREGRLDPAVEQHWRQWLEQEQCPTEFQPGGSHLQYEVVEGMVPSLRLVNPAMLLLGFPDFLDACHLKRSGVGMPDIRKAAAASGPERSAIQANIVYEGPGFETDPRYLEMLPRRVEVDFAAAAGHFSVYCAQHDVKHWPPELLHTLAPCDPSELLVPSWWSRGNRVPSAPTAWLCGGGPGGGPVTCNFHCDFSENFHVVLSGRKEFYLCHPSDITTLGGTSYCAQAAWSVREAHRGSPPRMTLEPVIRSDLCTPMCVASIDRSFEENCRLCPGLRPAAEQRRKGGGVKDHAGTWHHSGPLWAELCAGDAIYIPPGWLHAVRTWPPEEEERGLPFSVAVNFWYDCVDELLEKEKLFRFLQEASISQALVDPK